MKYRLFKKCNKNARCRFIADKLGTVHRGVWVEYFKKHPTDLPNVLKLIESERSRNILRKDIRKNYHNPDFNQTDCNWTIHQLENGYFVPYTRHEQTIRVFYSLRDIPLFEVNPYGVGGAVVDGLKKSFGPKYEN